MTDGAASLMAMFYGMTAAGVWTGQRRSNLLDGGAQFYDTYECRDGRCISLGSIEPQFYALLLEKAGLTDPALQAQMNRADWPALKAKLAAVIKTKTRDEWCAIMDGSDVCFAPVLEPRRGAAAIRTTPRARPSSRSRASCSRRPRRASRPRPARSRARRRRSAPTPTTCSPTGAWRSPPRPTRLRNAGRRCRERADVCGSFVQVGFRLGAATLLSLR